MTSETAKKFLHMRQPGGPEGAPWLGAARGPQWGPWLSQMQNFFGWLKPLSPQLFHTYSKVGCVLFHTSEKVFSDESPNKIILGDASPNKVLFGDSYQNILIF